MCVDEFVDGGLIRGSTLSNCRPMPCRRSLHGDAALGVDVALRARQPEAEPHLRAVVERARGPDGDAAAAQVQRQRRGDGVAEAVRDRNAEHHARAAAPVEVVGEQVRRQRRQDVLHGAVLVHVAGDAQRRQLAHFVGVGDRAAEDQDRQPAAVQLADAADEIDTGGVGQAQIDDEQIDLGEVGAHPREQLDGALDRHGAVARRLQRGLEAVSDERGVVGDEDGLGARRGSAHEATVIPSVVSECDGFSVSVRCRIYQVLAIIRTPPALPHFQARGLDSGVPNGHLPRM